MTKSSFLERSNYISPEKSSYSISNSVELTDFPKMGNFERGSKLIRLPSNHLRHIEST